MITRLDPPGVPKPASAYAQAIVHPAGARRVVISGQIGMDEAGRVADGLEAQIARAFDNLVTVARSAGAGPEHIVKIVAYMVAPGDVGLYRRHRDRVFAGNRAASTYVVVTGLAAPGLLFEVDGEAIVP